MEWGSSYIYDYQSSEDEELSCGELEEGMWLSDSEGDDDPSPPPVPPRTARPGLLTRMFKRLVPTSTNSSVPTSHDNESYDSDTSNSDEDTSVVSPPSPLNRSKELNYVELDLDVSKPRDRSSSDPLDDKLEGSPGKYAQLAELRKEEEKEKAKNTLSGKTLATPTGASIPPPPPPPAPMKHLHGIMKGGVKKQKKRRVRWDKSYRSKTKDSSRGGVHTRRTDTNVFAVKFNSLAAAGNLHTGDAQVCTNKDCGAIVSHLTKLEGPDDDIKKLWVCEFCGTHNDVELVLEEVPTEEDTTYLLTPAAALSSGNDGEGVGPVGSDSLVVFCIDISGSMCVTTEVPGKFELRGAKEKKEKMLQSIRTDLGRDGREVSMDNQYTYGQRRDVTWISRMESLQAAIDTQLSQLAHTEPAKRVCLVTFSNDVVIFGDGRSLPVTIAGDKLNDSKAVVDTGSAITLPAPIRDTHKALSSKVYSLEESGQTALGPAVLVSIVIASQRPGSKVIVCTDGLANIGLGGLDVSEKAYASAVNFYDDLADIALEKGVTMSLLKIKGSDCRAVELGQVASRTGGHVTTVDPLTVTEEFGSILTNPVLATDVISKVVLHQGLYLRNTTEKDAQQVSVLVKQVGNVTADSELTYEYGIRKRSQRKTPTGTPSDKTAGDGNDSEEEVKSKSKTSDGATPVTTPPVTTPPVLINGELNYPFQLQIEYNSLNGDKCLRVITKVKPATKDRELAEREMDVGVIGSHVARTTAELTMQGEFTKARVKSLSTQKMLYDQRNTSDDRRWEYDNYCYNMIPVETEIRRMQHSEEHDLSAEEYEEEIIERGSALTNMSFSSKKKLGAGFISQSTYSEPPLHALPKRKVKAVARRQKLTDDMSEGLYAFQKTSSTAFRSPVSSTDRSAPPKPNTDQHKDKDDETKKSNKKK